MAIFPTVIEKDADDGLLDGKKHITVVVIGCTGAGKSTLANTLVGTKIFKEGDYATPETKEVKSATVKYGKSCFRIVDTIGIGDNTIADDLEHRYPVDIINAGLDGINQVLFVTSRKFGRKELDAWKHLTAIFGDSVSKHVVIVRTRANFFQSPEKCHEDIERIKATGPEVRRVFESAKAVIHVDNPPAYPERYATSSDILEKSRRRLLRVLATSGEELYRLDSLEDAQKRLQQHLTEKRAVTSHLTTILRGLACKPKRNSRGKQHNDRSQLHLNVHLDGADESDFQSSFSSRGVVGGTSFANTCKEEVQIRTPKQLCISVVNGKKQKCAEVDQDMSFWKPSEFSTKGMWDVISKGVYLTVGDRLLHDIAKQFSLHCDVTGLATYLLEGVGKGGPAFVESLTSADDTLSPFEVALEVLREWSRQRPQEALSEKLHEVLCIVHPAAAVKFEAQLLGNACQDDALLKGEDGIATSKHEGQLVVSPKAADARPLDPEKGVALTESMPLLWKISEAFTTQDSCIALAEILFEGVGKGGHAFLSGLQDEGGVVPPAYAAHKVLQEWCRHQPQHSYGKNLLSVLELCTVNPSAANCFRAQLSGSTSVSMCQLQSS